MDRVADAFRGRFWAAAAVAAVVGAALGPHDFVWLPGVWLAALSCLCIALRSLQLGRLIVGPVAAWAVIGAVAIAAQAAGSRPRPSPPLDLPGRNTNPATQLAFVDEGAQLARDGMQLDVRWLASCPAGDVTPGGTQVCAPRWGRLLLRLPGTAPPPPCGTVLRVRSSVHPPPGFRNPGARAALDRWPQDERYGRLLPRSRSAVALLDPSAEPAMVDRLPVSLPRLGRWARLRCRVQAWRRRVGSRLDAQIDQPASGVVRALAIGDRAALQPQLRSWLRRSGTAHILAVSGAHLGVVLLLTLMVCRGLIGRLAPGLLRLAPMACWQFLPCVVVSWGYALLTGLGPSTCRAATMASLALVLRAVARRVDVAEVVGATVVAFLLADPDATSDVGLQLSVLGVVGVAWGGRRRETFDRSPGPGRVARAGAATLAAWATTAPVSVPVFGLLPLAAPLANLIVVPVVGLILLPGALLLGTLCALPDYLGGAVAVSACARIAQVAVAPLIAMAESSEGLWPVLHVGGVLAIGVGAAVPLSLAVCWHGGRHRVVLGCLLALALFAVAAAAELGRRPPPGSVNIHHLDVGHGDATLVEWADGRTMIIDGGGALGDDGLVGDLAVVPFLRARNVRSIDILVLSHAHPDHENGLLAVARAMPVGELWWTGQAPRGAEHPRLMELLRAGDTRWRRFEPGDGGERRFAIAGTQLAVLWPAETDASFDDHACMNDNSLVLDLGVGDRHVLFAGDIEHGAEAALVASGRLPQGVALLKVPHHGSRTSSTPLFLHRVSPRIAVAGARRWGRLPFPHPAIEERYRAMQVPLWVTCEGHVEVRISARGLLATQANRSLEVGWAAAGHRSAPHPEPDEEAQPQHQGHR